MAEKSGSSKPPASFEYELFEGDPDHLRTVVAAPSPVSPWIDPLDLKLKHRIGRGTFGDVWLGTHHQKALDFEEYHEVVVKMLQPVKEECVQAFMDNFERVFYKCREIQGVCWLHGVSVVNGKICLIMKVYEGSISDRMASSKAGKLRLSDTLRYGIQLAKATADLHAIGLLVLNLKPSNFLIDERDQLILGDFGIAYLLLEIPLLNPDMALRHGTPHYMAPEQWEPEVRGPMSLETDSWGFGCGVVEMLTGIPPWFGMSIEEMRHSIVIKQEKPQLPTGLPPAVENLITGCFEYDLRNRPLMKDIVHAFESSLNAFSADGEWTGLESSVVKERSGNSGHTSWYLLKDHLQLGDDVRSRKLPNARKPPTMDIDNGTVAGLDADLDRNGFVLVKISRMHNLLRVQESALERVTCGFAVGDWVRLKNGNSLHSPVGIVHSVHRNGHIEVGFVGLGTLWKGSWSELQLAKAYYVGQFVRVKASVLAPRFQWPCKRGDEWATGRISQILPNGCLVVDFPGRLVFGDQSNSALADPADTELVSFDTCPSLVEKYQHVEDFHWAVRPLAIALSVFTTLKLISAGRKACSKMQRSRKCNNDEQAGGNPTWLPPPVANILFKEGAASTAAVR